MKNFFLMIEEMVLSKLLTRHFRRGDPLELSAVELLKVVDQHLAERIIDPCGYDPEKESREDLIALVKSLSEENEALLNRVRGQFKIIP